MTKWFPTKKKGRLTYKNKQELIRICTRIVQITEQVTSRADCVAVLETCLCHLVGQLDKPTRDNLFNVVSLIVDAKHEAGQRSLVTEQMLKALKDGQKDINAGLVAKNLTDALLANVKKYGVNVPVKDDIFKSVIVRLAMELSHNEVDQVIYYLLPDIKLKKEQEQTRFMYG